MSVRRSLFLHSELRRRPYDLLRSMLAQVDPATPPNGPDGPVATLERRVASLLGTDEALFFPSGTMAQQVAVRIHADRRGRRAFAAHPQCHLEVWEQQGYAVVHGLRFQPVGDRHRLITLADLAAVAEPLAAAVWELPQRDIGGVLPEWDDLVAQTTAMRERGAAVHLDGARLWEAQTYCQRPFAEIVALFDTAYVSFYKGLQGVGGAALAGDADTDGRGAGVAPPARRRRLRRVAAGAHRTARPGHRAVPAAGAPGARGGDRGGHQRRRGGPRLSRTHRRRRSSTSTSRSARTPRCGPPTPCSPPTGWSCSAGSGPHQIPDRCSFEVSVGENAMDLAPDEVVTFLHELLRRAT